jgi:hypothetical protein
VFPFGSVRKAVSPSLFQMAEPTEHQKRRVPKSSPHPEWIVTVSPAARLYAAGNV